MKQVNPSLRKKIKTLLHSNVCTITFVKTNGEEREMVCTLLEQFLPLQETNTDNPIEFRRRSSNESVAVWDLEKNDWRSFRYDSITSLKIKTNNVVIDMLRNDFDE
jgi:hypothetical protein